ncbi:cell division cycle-associated protein 3 [Periophthalmus magnuspinnatus]|uniref:cell division cycle-associated protein 3 n=1 Tax=Periophthalmus magnuspinnatus TaxID=409849 RepID=UPI00145A3CE5|nr:cell division cycle-associated protein 3 [Periophthalmus magnuspinnatus]
MGSSESKLAVAPPETKPVLPFKAARVQELLDPRSPSAGIDRTPIEVCDAAKSSAEMKRFCPLAETDPRSPSVGITRTPAREVMRATVGTLARRLGLLFHNDTENKTHQNNVTTAEEEDEDDSKPEEIASTEPILTPRPSDILSSPDTNTTTLDTPQPPPPQTTDSPFVHLADPQFEVELETEPDFSLEEAEEARETPLHKRLSLSLIACHEGSASSQIYEDVSNDSFANIERSDTKPPVEEDHSYAVPSISVQSPVEPSIPDDVNANDAAVVSKIPSCSEEMAPSLPEKTKRAEIAKEPNAPQESKAETNAPSPRPNHIRCPTIDSKSPSQIVFKPQWLAKGFGGAGQRVRAQGGKGGSSPLALHVAVKKVANENKGQTGKPKSKGNEGRSPLQILKETNSPRGQRAQMKLKTSTPERRRSAHGERRVLAVAVDKENR